MCMLTAHMPKSRLMRARSGPLATAKNSRDPCVAVSCAFGSLTKMLQVRWSINAGNPNKRKTLACAYDPIKKRQHNFGNEAKEVVQAPRAHPAQTAVPARPTSAPKKPSKKQAKATAEAAKAAAEMAAAASLGHADTSASIGAFLSTFEEDGDMSTESFCLNLLSDDPAGFSDGTALALAPGASIPEAPASDTDSCGMGERQMDPDTQDPLAFLVGASPPAFRAGEPDTFVAPASPTSSIVTARPLATCSAAAFESAQPRAITKLVSTPSMVSVLSHGSAATQCGDASIPSSPKRSPCMKPAVSPLKPVPELAFAPAPAASLGDDLLEDLAPASEPAAPAPADEFFHLVSSLADSSDTAAVAAGADADAVLDGLCDFDGLTDLTSLGESVVDSSRDPFANAPAASAEDFALAGACSMDVPVDALHQLASPSLPLLAGLTFTGFDSPLKKRKSSGSKPADKPKASAKMTKAAAKQAAEAAAEAEAEAEAKAKAAYEAEAKATAMRQAADEAAKANKTRASARSATREKSAALAASRPATTKTAAAAAVDAVCATPVKAAHAEQTVDPELAMAAAKEARLNSEASPEPSTHAGDEFASCTPSTDSKKAQKKMKWQSLAPSPVLSTTVTTTTTTTTTHRTEYEYVVPAATVTPAPTIPIGVPVAPPAMAAPAQPSMGMQFTWQPLKIAGMQGTQAK